MGIVLSTLPTEGEFVNWTTPKDFLKDQSVVKYMPLGILSLASNIKDEIKILDPPTNGWTIEETIIRIESEKPDILGLSAITRRAYALKQILRKIDVPYVVVGGPHTTNHADLILEQGADAVFIGQLADNEFSKIWKKPSGKIYCNTKINDINMPNRELLNFQDYFYDGKVLFEAEKRMPMFSSIGCFNRCTFCNVQSKRVQYKDPKIIVDEMEHLHKLGSRSVHILDDNFNINSSHLSSVLIEMESRKLQIEWSGRGQVRMNYNLVKRMKDTGFKRIHVGIEALDNDILKYFNKPQKVEHIEKFCEVMNENDIDVLGYFIIGSPVETETYRRELPQKIRNLGIKFPWFNILFPEPNTEYYKSLLRDGYYKKDYWGEFMKNPTPNFEIPYPYGKEVKKDVIKYVNKLIGEFKK